MAAAGGSTNGILHLLALAREAQVDFGLKDIQPILRNTPVLCSFAPRGKRTMVDLHHLGGTPVLLNLLAAGLIDGSVLTVTGKTMAENLADVRRAGRPRPHRTPRPALQRVRRYADLLWQSGARRHGIQSIEYGRHSVQGTGHLL